VFVFDDDLIAVLQEAKNKEIMHLESGKQKTMKREE